MTKDTWQAFTLKDAYKPRKGAKYIVDKILELPSLNIFYGPPGAMKSILLADLSICVASGMEWLPPLPKDECVKSIKILKSPVVWVDLDNGRRRTHERFEGLGKARKLPESTPITYYSMPNPILDGSNNSSMENLKIRIKALNAKLVIIDNLGIVKGKAKENDDSMTMVMNRFRQLAEETGAAIIIIHHIRKSNGDNNGRAGESLRGFGGIEASLDYAYLVERDSKMKDVVKIVSTKDRDMAVEPFAARFTFEHKENGDLKTAKFWGYSVEDNRPEAKVKKTVKEILKNGLNDGTLEGTISIVMGIHLNKKQLAKAVHEQTKVGMNAIGKIIDTMEKEGEVNISEGKRNEKIYSSP